MSRFSPASGQATALHHGTIGSRRRHRIRMLTLRIAGTGMTLLIMLALKHYYSLATADQLTWILSPTARLVAWLTPARFTYESGVGYADFVHGIVVAPACAGVNFMIMSFGFVALWGLARTKHPVGTMVWPVAAMGVAYGYTLPVNALRISLSMALYAFDIYGGWLTVQRVHRLIGIALYLGALTLLHTILQAAVRRDYRHDSTPVTAHPVRLPGWLPPIWYGLGAVGVPSLNLLFRQRSAGYIEHCVTVLITIACLWGALRLAVRLYRRIGRVRHCGSTMVRQRLSGFQRLKETVRAAIV
jgi:exosortase K